MNSKMTCMFYDCKNQSEYYLYSKVQRGTSLYGKLCEQHSNQELERFREMGRESYIKKIDKKT